MNIPFADSLLHAYVARGARARAVAPIAEWRLADTERVLLVLTTGLGDAILSTPVFPAVRKALPHADVRLLCRAAWAPLFEGDPDIDRVIAYPGKYRRFFPLVRALRTFRPDLAIILHGNDPDIIPLAYLAGSRFIVRIPTAGTRYGFLLSNRDRDSDRETVPGVHYIDNRLRILDTLGIAPVTTAPRVHLDPALQERARAEHEARRRPRPYWVLHAFAADTYKNWPASRSHDLLARTAERYPKHTVLLTGAREERPALLDIAAGFSHARVVAGEMNIAETAACLADAACVVGPDTGVLHLAAALGAPVVGLYGATSAALVGPRSGHPASVVIEKPTDSARVGRQFAAKAGTGMARITVDEVLAAMSRVLGR